MISVSGRNWKQKKTNKNSVEKLKQDYNFSDIVSKLIISRNLDETELNSISNELQLKNVFLKTTGSGRVPDIKTNGGLRK